VNPCPLPVGARHDPPKIHDDDESEQVLVEALRTGGLGSQQMKSVIGWQRLDTAGVEYAEVESAPLRLEGQLVFSSLGDPCAVSYRVDCDDAGITTRAVVCLRRAGLVSERTIVRHPDGSWTANDLALPELIGLLDVDLSVTPSTNTLPIRRLQLAIGQRADVTAAWVKFPSLDVVPLRQSYRRSAAGCYEYEAHDLGFRAQMSVDDEGLVHTYGGLWTRLVVPATG